MGMMLPDELIWIMDKLGFEWPDLDEDEIHRGADIVRRFGVDLAASIQAVDRRVNTEVAAGSSKTALAYVDAWNQNRSQNLQRILDYVEPAATGVDIFADAVLALKVKVIAEVTVTAAQVAAALASSFVTFGAGAAVAAGLIIARKKAMDILVDVAIDELMEQVLPMVIEPMAERIPAIVAAVLDAPVVSGVVGDVGELKADLDALEEVSADLDLAAADQEALTHQLLADLESLHITGA